MTAHDLSRRDLLRGAALVGALALGPRSASARQAITIGAIRWDPWYQPEPGSERKVMEHTLGPSRWQGRAPACALVRDRHRIGLESCATQAQIDLEIGLAADAGLDYWAYCWYGPEHPMQSAWRLHQSSRLRRRINTCFLFASSKIFVGHVQGALGLHLRLLADDGYQSVPGGRKLVFILLDGTDHPDLAASIRAFRAAAGEFGLADPYVVLLRTGRRSTLLAHTDADAIGAYFTPSPEGTQTYVTLAADTVRQWAELAATGRAIVPTAMTGLDRRPRIERPVPWEAHYQKPNAGLERYYEDGTPEEIAGHIGAMLDWLRANGVAAPARTGLVYSWNEHDEGGSTLNATLGQGDRILQAVGNVLRRR